MPAPKFMAIHPTAVEKFPIPTSQGIPEVIRIYLWPQFHIRTNFYHNSSNCCSYMSQRRKHATPSQKDLSSEDHECHGNPSSRCWAISKVVHQPTDRSTVRVTSLDIPRPMLLAWLKINVLFVDCTVQWSWILPSFWTCCSDREKRKNKLWI